MYRVRLTILLFVLFASSVTAQVQTKVTYDDFKAALKQAAALDKTRKATLNDEASTAYERILKVDKSVPMLTRALKDLDVSVRQGAIHALFIECWRDSQQVIKTALPTISDTSAKDSDARVRSYAARVMGLVGDEDAVPILKRMLKDSDGSVRGIVAESLGAFGRKASGAIPELTQALGDENPTVRQAAKVALQRIQK